MRSSQLTNWSTPALPSMDYPGNLFEGNKILNWVLSVQKYITEHAGRFKGWKNEPNVYYSLVPIKSSQYMEKLWA